MYQPQSIKRRLQVTMFQCPAQVFLSPFDLFAQQLYVIAHLATKAV